MFCIRVQTSYFSKYLFLVYRALNFVVRLQLFSHLLESDTNLLMYPARRTKNNMLNKLIMINEEYWYEILENSFLKKSCIWHLSSGDFEIPQKI